MGDALKLKLPWQVLALLGVVMTILLFLLWNTLFSSEHKISTHYKQMVVVEGITLQVSQAHLWLEEFVSSQDVMHLEQVNAAIKNMNMHLDTLKAMMPDVAHHSGHDVQSLTQEVESLIALTHTFRKITAQRLAQPLAHPSDGILDETLDATYGKIISRAKNIEQTFKDDFAQYDREESNQKNSLYEHYQYITLNDDVILSLSQAHLWLEEFVNSRNPNHLPKIQAAMTSADEYISQLKSVIIKLHSGDIANAELITHANELTQYAKAFQTIIDQRILAPEQNNGGSLLDENMDIIYANILQVSTQIQADIKSDFSHHESEQQQHNIFTFIAVLFLALLSLGLILFEDKKRRDATQAQMETLTHLTGAEKKFADLFELSPVSLWLEDFSEVMSQMKKLKDKGVQDIQTYCDTHPELLMECAQKVRILDVNQATLTLHGAESKAQLMAGLPQTFTEQSLAAFKKEILEVLDGKTETLHSAQVKKLDGTIVDVIVSARVMPGHEKSLDRLLVALIDISDQSEAERQLRASEARFRAMIEQSPLSTIIYTPTGIPTQVNQAFHQLWNVTLEDLAGYNILEDEQLVEKGVMPLIESAFAGETVNLPALNYNPEDGLVVQGPKNEKWVSSFMYPVFNDNGEMIEVVLTHEDVTKKLQQEAQLLSSQQSLEEAQRLAKVGSWALDLQSNNLVWSDEIFRIFEIDKDKFGATYEAFLDAIHPDDRERVNAAYNQSLTNKQPYEIEHRLLFGNGQIKYVQERCESFFDSDGTPLRSVGTVQDITELAIARQKETSQIEKIEHVQRLESLGVLAGGIAHDFNNLLTVIMGNAALASKHISETHDAKRFVSNIESTSERAASLCNQMLAYSGKGKFIVKPLQLGVLIEEMSQLLMVSISKNIVFRLELNNQIPAVDADATQMQQIIMNLVINASEAIGKRSGSICIATGVVRADAAYLKSTFLDEDLAEGLYVYLEVSDTGIGMDEETKKKLFDPFYTTKFTGRGLGMAAVLGIVRGHNGAIKVYSELGKGSTFKIMLPCSEEKPDALDQKHIDSDGWFGEGTVLVVDDEETIREVVASMLQEIGFDVLTACDGIEGVEMYRTHQHVIKAVLLDMTMPRMGGEDAFSEMCRINPDVKVILSSGYNQQDATNRFAGKGLAGFLQKPYMTTALARALKDILKDKA